MKTYTLGVFLASLFLVTNGCGPEKSGAPLQVRPDGEGEDGERVAFPDTGLTSAVYDALGVADRTFTRQALLSLEVLDAGGHGITRLDGISALSGLKTLILSDNQIRDLSPLAELAMLSWLDLSNNRITDLSPLGSLRQLRDLQLSFNEIAEIRGINSLEQLETLFLDHNPVVDISLLLEVKSLRYLDISDSLRTDSLQNGYLNQLEERGVEISFGEVQVPAEEVPAESVVSQIIQTKIAFVANLNENGIFDIYVLDAQGKLKRLTHDPREERTMSWSPDGRKIVFERWGYQGGSDLFVVNVESGIESRLTETPAHESSPAWSPDGSRIAFISNENQEVNIFTMDTDGGDRTQITDNGVLWVEALDWAPDGGNIVYSVPVGFHPPEKVGIYAIDINERVPRLLSDRQTISGTLPEWEGFEPAVSPDGRTVIFTRQDVFNPQLKANESWIRRKDIVSLDLGTHVQRSLTEQLVPEALGTNFAVQPCWSPDGSRVLFVAFTENIWSDLYVMDAQGGNLVRLADVSQLGQGTFRYLNPSWSPE